MNSTVLMKSWSEQPDDRRREEGDHDRDDEAARVRVARQRHQHAPEPAEIDDDHRQDRAELDQDVESVPKRLVAAAEAENPGGEQKMRRSRRPE